MYWGRWLKISSALLTKKQWLTYESLWNNLVIEYSMFSKFSRYFFAYAEAYVKPQHQHTTTMGQSTNLRWALLLACIHPTLSAYHTPSIMPMPSPRWHECRRHSRGTVRTMSSSEASSSSGEDGPTLTPMPPSTTLPVAKSPFNGGAFEANRLLRDAEAMDSMREAASSEYSKFHMPWKWSLEGGGNVK